MEDEIKGMLIFAGIVFGFLIALTVISWLITPQTIDFGSLGNASISPAMFILLIIGLGVLVFLGIIALRILNWIQGN